MASLRRAIDDGTPHDVEYRVVAPDGTERWVEGKGRVEHEGGRPVRMSGVCMIVTPRKEAEHARLASAEEASRLKDDFLATLSHELRTPLNAILGWVQMLLAGTLPADRARQAIDIIGRNAKAQAQLIEDILDISRIITGKLEIETPARRRCRSSWTASSAPPCRRRAPSRSRSASTCPDGLPPIDGDPKRLQQVLSSVVANAIKFTPEKGDRRDPAPRPAATASRSRCATPAPASRAEFLPHVFDRFRQADSRATRRHGGLGLGLAIARHVLEQHRGDDHAPTATGPGRGTTITMRLPARPMPQGQRRGAASRRRTAGWRCASTAPRSSSSTISATRASCWRRCSSSAARTSCSAPTRRRRSRRCSRRRSSCSSRTSPCPTSMATT